ncbi:MAG: nicotinate (nicotinamide) nucleotide adenylyltransferase [Clostridia bacterium]|nr:nicotinate (nicotinamide) nucleotide adenylyltransferase [Clostridia bacterium]MBP5270944.1 nicotinate (nicotinamide) nucleotide adenylyltransferase [Clostridia bacterium]
MKTVVYGGSFDPPHIGHVRDVKLAISELSPDRVWVFPAFLSPGKTPGEISAGPEDRLRMCMLAFDGIELTSVRDDELRRGGVSFTADTVAALRAENPEDEFVLAMGSDQFLSFRRWYKYLYILSQASLFVVLRDGCTAERLREEASALSRETGCRIDVYCGSVLTASSTQVRQGGGTGILPPAVAEYVRERRLYLRET